MGSLSLGLKGSLGLLSALLQSVVWLKGSRLILGRMRRGQPGTSIGNDAGCTTPWLRSARRRKDVLGLVTNECQVQGGLDGASEALGKVAYMSCHLFALGNACNMFGSAI